MVAQKQDGPTVFVADWQTTIAGIPIDFNSELRANLSTEYGTLLDAVAYSATDGDVWWQDPFEIGYVQAPYGSQYVILALPRSTHYASPNFLDYAKNNMIRNGVGLYDTFAVGTFNNQEDGGNFEVMPGKNDQGNTLGKIVMATGHSGSMNSNIVNFLRAQGVQDVIDDVDLSWMYLGHIDEVISFASSANGRSRVASPEAAYALLLHAKQNLGVTGTQPIFTDMNFDDFTLNELIQEIQNNYLFLFGPDSYAEKIRTNVIQKLDLDSQNYTIRSSIGGISQYSLTRIGYLEGNDHFGGGKMVEWKLEFTSNVAYNLYYRKDGTSDPWIFDGTGNRNTDFISNSGMVYILHTWWGYATTAGQGVTFATYPSPDIIEMPVFFYNFSDGLNQGARAFTNNVINSLVDGNTMFCPHVDGPSNVFNNYVSYVVTKNYLGKNEEGSIVLKSSEISSVIFSNDFYYHVGCGSIHCGTNVLRKMPVFGSGKEWWMLFDEEDFF